MSQQKATPEQAAFYANNMREIACGLLKKVCEANNINLQPTSGAELCPIPVYEDTTNYNLLTSAQMRHETTIRWALNPGSNFLPAYIKKYKVDNRIHSEIVVTIENYCYARFFAAKELMHCFLDNDGYEATNTIQEVNELIETLAAGSGSSFITMEPSHLIDEIAWLGACEYLVPESWIDLLLSAHASITAQQPNVNAFLSLAQHIRVPELILRVRLRQALTIKQTEQAQQVQQ